MSRQRAFIFDLLKGESTIRPLHILLQLLQFPNLCYCNICRSKKSRLSLSFWLYIDSVAFFSSRWQFPGMFGGQLLPSRVYVHGDSGQMQPRQVERNPQWDSARDIGIVPRRQWNHCHWHQQAQASKSTHQTVSNMQSYRTFVTTDNFPDYMEKMY